MEMPKGLQEIAKVMRSEGTPTRDEIKHMIYLMRSMAAALDAGLKYEDCPTDEPCHIAGHEEMKEALRRYKEWE